MKTHRDDGDGQINIKSLILFEGWQVATKRNIVWKSKRRRKTNSCRIILSRKQKLIVNEARSRIFTEDYNISLSFDTLAAKLTNASV